MDYLKEKQYYIDNYDFKTIEECLYYAQRLHKEIQKFQKIKDKEKISDKKMGEDFLRMISMVATSMKATRFEHKEKTIESWMEKDREKQDKFDNTESLEIYCDECEILMEPMHKSL